MASTFYDGFERNAARGAIDLPIAALAAVSVGFVAYAMPADLFGQAIAATGLPSLLTAAQPPLGTTARMLVVGVAAVATFLFVFGLLRLLDRRGGRPAAAAPARVRVRAVFVPDETEEAEPPRLRRADSHPDAPARRPILAGSELGEPNLARPYPQRSTPKPEPEPEEATWEPVENFVEPEPEPEAPIAVEPEPAPAFEPVPAPASDDSIADLVARLERGLGRRQQGGAAQHNSEPIFDSASPPASEPERDDRLRSAIENLQRLASKA